MKYIAIPKTAIVDSQGQLSREWLYFFNDVGKVVDEAISANLGQMTKDLLQSADTASLSLSATPACLHNHHHAIDGVPILADMEYQKWLLLTNN